MTSINCIKSSDHCSYGLSIDEESRRADSLDRSVALLQDSYDVNFDRLALMAARALMSPIVLISIVDYTRLWFKSKVGLNATEIPRDFAFCNYTIRDDAPDVFIVLDATLDPRFCDKNFVIGPPYAKFYAGAPVYFEKVKIGSFCILDGVPHDSIDDRTVDLLQHFASLASDLITQHRAMMEMRDFGTTRLNMALVKLLKEPIDRATEIHRNMFFKFEQMMIHRSFALCDDSERLAHKFKEHVQTIQKALEIALRFACAIAFQQPTSQLNGKRKAVYCYSTREFTHEFRRMVTLDGFKDCAINWQQNEIKREGIYSVLLDPTLLSAAVGFLMLKFVTHCHSETICMSILPLRADDEEGDLLCNSFSNHRKGEIQVDIEFVDVDMAVHSAHDDLFDFSLIQEIISALKGTFKEQSSMKSSHRSFRFIVPCMMSLLSATSSQMNMTCLSSVTTAQDPLNATNSSKNYSNLSMLDSSSADNTMMLSSMSLTQLEVLSPMSVIAPGGSGSPGLLKRSASNRVLAVLGDVLATIASPVGTNAHSSRGNSRGNSRANSARIYP